jgi:predicted acylesterase/phospholipase RssA
MEKGSEKPSSTKRKEKLPKKPFQNIAISLSGGGFRATSFHLGLMTYLSTRQWEDVTLLERTRILSTISAGSFVGVKYVTTLKKGGTIIDCYRSLHNFMSRYDLVSESLQFLSDDKSWKMGMQRSLINSFAFTYHKEFESATFGLLWDESVPIHVKEICFSATEFNFALPFRFQKTEKTRLKMGGIRDEHVGNEKIYIPLEVAKEIRLADIIAASSCFPFGFEPINFPDDFIYPESDKLKNRAALPQYTFDGDKISYPVALMDGSIDDNQGTEAVIIAEERMRNYPDNLKQFCSDDDKVVDLYIISDVSPPPAETVIETQSDKVSWYGKLTFDGTRNFGMLCAAIGIVSVLYAFFATYKLTIIFLSVLGTLSGLTAIGLLIFSMGLTGLTRKMGVPEYVVKRLLHFDKLKFGTLYNMVLRRRESGMKLVTHVFLKQMKWFSFERIFGDVDWRSRIMINAARKLTPPHVQKRREKYFYFSPELLEPGDEIMRVAAKANTMKTTLWFVTEELEGKENMLDTLIACGQFTTCFNLLEYIEKTLKRAKYKNDYEAYDEKTRAGIDKLQQELMEDWKKFKADPYWMVREWNARIGSSK